MSVVKSAARAERVDSEAAEQWSRLWFSISERPWRTLALVPASPNVSALPEAERLLECARAYGTGGVQIIDAQNAAPADVAAVAEQAAECAARGQRVLIVLSSPRVCAPAIPLARGADAAVLVVPLGEAGILEARSAVSAVGHGRFLGSITVRGR